MKKQGFTLAEILISLMILGVIASLTIPSLIQNTTKKEQIVQLKKGLSMMNQAVTMNYALTGEDLSDAADAGAVVNMLRSRLSVVDSSIADAVAADPDKGIAAQAAGATAWVRTQDGLTYYIGQKVTGGHCGETGYDPVKPDQADLSAAGDGACFPIIVSTKNSSDAVADYGAATAKLPAAGAPVSGYYMFYASADRVVPTTTTQNIMNASDATKAAVQGAGG